MNRKQLIILTISLVLIFFPSTVKAGETPSAKCTKDIVSIEWKDANGNKITDPFSNTTNQLKVVVTASKGSWEVFYDVYNDGSGENKKIDEASDLFKDTENSVRKFKFNDEFKSLGSDKKYPASRTYKQDSKNYVALFIRLKEKLTLSDGSVCKAGNFELATKNIRMTNNGTGIWKTYKVSKPDSTVTTSGAKVNHSKAACERMRKGLYKKNGSTSEHDICYDENTKTTSANCPNLSDYQAKMKAYFPYCWSDTDTNLDISGVKINNIKQRFIKYYNTIMSIPFSSSSEIKAYNDNLVQLQNSSDWMEKKVEGEGSKNWKTNVGDLKCETSLVNTDGEKKYFAEKEVLSNDYCKVKCTEKFTTTYSPPKSVVAGLCFSYKVTVKSKVDCITEQTGNNLWPSNEPKSSCGGASYRAVCEDGTNQAGPNEEYDSCINDCDGGEYTKACSDKCYKKVYTSTGTTKAEKSSSSKKLKNSTSKNANLVLLANKKKKSFKIDDDDDDDKVKPYETYIDDDGKEYDLDKRCSSWSKLKNNMDICVEGFMAAKENNSRGEYVPNDKGYRWKPDKEVARADNGALDATYYSTSIRTIEKAGANSIVQSMRRVAPYYLRSKKSTEDLLKSFFGQGHYYGRTYNIDNQGIKRQSSSRYKCKEKCWFVVSSGTSNGDNGTCVNDVSKVLKKYKKSLNAKQGQIEKCSTTAAEMCKEEKQSDYTIGAKNKTVVKKVEDNKSTCDYGNYDDGFNNGNKSANSKEDVVCATQSQRNLLNDIFVKLPTDNNNDKCQNGSVSNGVNGKCYGTDYPNWHYKTTITFPGAWYNEKSRDTVYTGDHVGDDNYIFKEYQYCTRFNSAATNVDWWTWRTKSVNPTGTAPNVDDWNINATVKNFGKFNWNLDFACFYSTYNGDNECNDDGDGNEGTCIPTEENEYCCKKGENCKITSDVKDSIRFVREDDKLFAGRNYGETGSSSDSKNEIGFNWTKDAKDTALANVANARGYDIDPYEYGKKIMSGNTQDVYKNNPDVEITLTPQKASKVKSLLRNSRDGNGKTAYEIGDYTKNGKFIDSARKDIPNLVYYSSNIIKELGTDIIKINYTKGYNYK